METIFEFLFKYRPLLFQEGDFTFASPWPALLILSGVAVVALPALFTYGAARGDSRRIDRWVMAVLRLGLVAIARPRGTESGDVGLEEDLLRFGNGISSRYPIICSMGWTMFRTPHPKQGMKYSPWSRQSASVSCWLHFLQCRVMRES